MITITVRIEEKNEGLTMRASAEADPGSFTPREADMATATVAVLKAFQESRANALGCDAEIHVTDPHHRLSEYE